MGIFSDAFSSSNFSLSSDFLPESFYRAFGARRSATGLSVSDESAQGVSAFFACQRAISESIAILPRQFYKKLPDGGREVYDTPSNRVFKREANSLMASSRAIDILQRNAMRMGNGYGELQFDKKSGDVVGLWPIPSSKCNPKIIEKKNGDIDIVYVVTLPNGKEIIMPKDRILHIPGVGFDGRVGYPILDFAAQAVGLGEALETYSALFFKNGAGMPGYVTVPDSFTIEQIDNVKKHYETLNEGLDNAHRWKFLYESAKFEKAGATPAESQMVDSRVFQIQEIARFHRMPLHKIQETSKATGYSSLEQFNIEFASDTLAPWINIWEEEINRKFFPDEDDIYIKFNLNSILRGDAKARALFYRTMVFTSIMTPNEARALEDLPPIKGGDKRLVPLNMMNEGEEKDPEDDQRSDDANERIED